MKNSINYKIKRLNKPRKLKTKHGKYNYVTTLYDANNIRRHKYYELLEDAEEDYARLSCKLKPEEKQTAKDLMEYREAFAFAKTIGMTLEEMVFQYIKVQELLASQSLSDINIALSTYVEWRQKNNINITLGKAIKQYVNSEYFSNLRIATQKLNKTQLNRLVADFGVNTPLVSLGSKRLEEWLNNLVKLHKYQVPGELVSLATKHSMVTNYTSFWRFCVKKGFVSKNVASEIYLNPLKRHDPLVYTPEEIVSIIQVTPPKSDLRLYVCLATFVGLRPTEICKLKWSHINFEDKEIMLPSEVTKMSIRRVVNIPDNLMEWLSPWKNFAGSNSLVLKNGPSTQWCFLRRVRLTGIQPIHDGLRHSCASYLLVQSNDADYTAEQLGHCVPVLNKNYKGLVRKVASDKFYNIRPDANEQPEIRFKEI